MYRTTRVLACLTCPGPDGSLVGLVSTADQDYQPVLSSRSETLEGALLTGGRDVTPLLQ